MTKYFYYIDALPGLNFQSLNAVRKEYKAILKRDGISAQKLRSNSPNFIIRQSHITGAKTKFPL